MNPALFYQFQTGFITSNKFIHVYEKEVDHRIKKNIARNIFSSKKIDFTPFLTNFSHVRHKDNLAITTDDITTLINLSQGCIRWSCDNERNNELGPIESSATFVDRSGLVAHMYYRQTGMHEVDIFFEGKKTGSITVPSRELIPKVCLANGSIFILSNRNCLRLQKYDLNGKPGPYHDFKDSQVMLDEEVTVISNESYLIIFYKHEDRTPSHLNICITDLMTQDIKVLDLLLANAVGNTFVDGNRLIFTHFNDRSIISIDLFKAQLELEQTIPLLLSIKSLTAQGDNVYFATESEYDSYIYTFNLCSRNVKKIDKIEAQQVTLSADAHFLHAFWNEGDILCRKAFYLRSVSHENTHTFEVCQKGAPTYEYGRICALNAPLNEEDDLSFTIYDFLHGPDSAESISRSEHEPSDE